MEIKNHKVILRDFIESDIGDRIYWETIETEWKQWDAPWEYHEGEVFDSIGYRIDRLAWLSKEKEKDENRMRKSFQICINDESRKHIGWMNSYNIDNNYNFTRGQGHCTIGIDIPDMSSRRKGYATASWGLFIQYLLSNEIEDIYTQTWSGNERVIGLMNKLGFEECNRVNGYRTIKGQLYDGLTFKLNKEKYSDFHTGRSI